MSRAAELLHAHAEVTKLARLLGREPDELGYLDNARYLALGGNRPITGYYPGLSVLLAPIWRAVRAKLTTTGSIGTSAAA